MSRPYYLLLVDDDPDLVELTAEFLEREDDRFRTATETEPTAALDRLDEGDFDCVISDYQMPSMSGLEFLGRVRQTYPDLPFILFTGKGSEEVASDAISRGVTDYLQKGRGTDQYTVLANRVTNAIERKEAQTQLEEREAHLEQAQAVADIGSWYMDVEENELHWSDEVSDIFESYHKEEPITFEGFISLVHPDDREYVEKKWNSALEGESYDVEHRIVTGGGTKWVREKAEVEFDEDGTPVTAIGIVQDVTERKERERRLQRSRERFRALFEESPDSIALHDAEGDVVDVNERLVENLGYSRDELLSMNVAEYEVAHDCEELRGIWKEMSNGARVKAEGVHQRKDGTTYPVEVWVNEIEIDGEERFLALGRNVSDRKTRERELRSFKNAVEHAGHAICLTDEDGTILYVNPAFEEITGYSSEEALGRNPRILKSGEHEEEFYEDLWDTITSGEVWKSEIVNERKDGEHYTVHQTIAPIENDDGEIERFVAVNSDITAQKEHEELLERERDRFATLFEAIPEPAVQARLEDEGAVVSDVNEAFSDVFGYTAEEAVGEIINDLIVPGDEEAEARAIDDTAREGVQIAREVRRGAEDGVRDFLLRTAPVRDDGDSTEQFGVYLDITERKAYEEKLERKNEQLGEFANVVSHDLRNPLNVAMGRLELAREECGSEHLDAVERLHDRMEALIEDLLTVAKEGSEVTVTERVDLGEFFEDCWQNVDTADATLVTESNVAFRADRNRLKQLVENLLRNAVEHGGEDVTVTVGDLDEDAGFYVADDGPGVPADEREQVFEFGFSTSDGGTGFGLHIAEQVAEAHGWEVRATESDDGGMRFEATGVEFVDE